MEQIHSAFSPEVFTATIACPSRRTESVMTLKPVLIVQHQPAVDLGVLKSIFTEMRTPFVRLLVDNEGPSSLPLGHVAGLVVLGGTMSAYDDRRYPFLAREADWLCEAIERPIPVLGICLGAQMMARALGASVYAAATREIGWYRIEMLPECRDDPLLSVADSSATVFHWHGDTFDLPEGAVRLARGVQAGRQPPGVAPSCENQAFRFGRWNYALQFHVEMTPRLMRQWLNNPEFTAGLAGLPHIDLSRTEAEAPKRFAEMEPFTQAILRRFIAQCNDE